MYRTHYLCGSSTPDTNVMASLAAIHWACVISDETQVEVTTKCAMKGRSSLESGPDITIHKKRGIVVAENQITAG